MITAWIHGLLAIIRIMGAMKIERHETGPRMSRIVIHGDKDPTVSVEESRKMVKAGQELGIKIKYIEVRDGNHGNIVVPAFKDIFDWFDAHKRQTAVAAKAAGVKSN